MEKSIFERTTICFDKVKSWFERVVKAIGEMKEESYFYNVRKVIIEFVGKKEEIDTCALTLHLEKEKYDIKVFFDLFYTSAGKIYKQNNIKLSYELFEDCGMPAYIVDELNKSNKCDIAFTFEDLKQLYDEMSVDIVNKLSYKEIFNQCQKDYDSVILIDRVFYTRLEYYSGNNIIEQVHVGFISDIPNLEYSEIYPYKSKKIER